jgi:hypothetical protein
LTLGCSGFARALVVRVLRLDQTWITRRREIADATGFDRS